MTRDALFHFSVPYFQLMNHTPRKELTSPRKMASIASAVELTASRSEVSVIADVVRAFFCGVVVESAGHEGLAQGEPWNHLAAHLKTC